MALPGRVVAERELFFIRLGGPKAHGNSGRDDKGEMWLFQRVKWLNRSRFSSP
jgi:hypothetical protein